LNLPDPFTGTRRRDMARITLDDLEVASFFTDEAPDAAVQAANTGRVCELTFPAAVCICTADISTCSRTSVEGGCDTSVQCVTV
jgi:hypothetical protein